MANKSYSTGNFLVKSQTERAPNRRAIPATLETTGGVENADFALRDARVRLLKRDKRTRANTAGR